MTHTCDITGFEIGEPEDSYVCNLIGFGDFSSESLLDLSDDDILVFSLPKDSRWSKGKYIIRKVQS